VRVLGRILALVLTAATLAIAGCGGNDKGDPIPAATADSLQSQLDGVQARLDQGSAGACKDILEGPRGPNKQQVQDLIDSLPDSVDSDVRSALQDSFDRLWDLVDQECQDKESKTQTDTTPTDTTPTDTTPTDTTPTDTTPTDTTPTDTTPTTPTSPDTAPLPNDGNGNGGGVPGAGNGNGKSNGGGGGVGPGD
jgi:hypothetical protein